MGTAGWFLASAGASGALGGGFLDFGTVVIFNPIYAWLMLASVFRDAEKTPKERFRWGRLVVRLLFLLGAVALGWFGARWYGR